MIKFFTKTKKVDGVTEVEVTAEVKPLIKKKDCELKEEIEEEFMKRKIREYLVKSILTRPEMQGAYYSNTYANAIDDLVLFLRTGECYRKPEKK